jgi:hypothetical protein
VEDSKTSSLKLVFYRPHAEFWFKSTVRSILRKNRLPNKYAALFDYALNSDMQIYLMPKLAPSGDLKAIFKSIIDLIELTAWCILNDISLRKVGLIFGKRGLTGKAAFFVLHYGNFTHESKSLAQCGAQLANDLAEVSIYKVVHMTHYVYNPIIGFNNLKAFLPDLLVAENNLGNNSPFFREFFGKLESNFHLLPYTPDPRFKNRKKFEDRVNKLVVTGSITYKMKDDEFIRFYKQNELQPLRRELYENSKKYRLEMECLLNDLDAVRLNARVSSANRIVKRIFRLLKGFPLEHAYYKTDIVATYNKHMMFAVPEEICDLPAIGFVEGMACGCAYFGLDDPMYREIGLIPGVHYIAHDGTTFDLMAKVRYYQNNIDELKIIAKSGNEFVTNTLTEESVYPTFFALLKQKLANK